MTEPTIHCFLACWMMKGVKQMKGVKMRQMKRTTVLIITDIALIAFMKKIKTEYVLKTRRPSLGAVCFGSKVLVFKSVAY